LLVVALFFKTISIAKNQKTILNINECLVVFFLPESNFISLCLLKIIKTFIALIIEDGDEK
jgi:hypothetical protein